MSNENKAPWLFFFWYIGDEILLPVISLGKL